MPSKKQLIARKRNWDVRTLRGFDAKLKILFKSRTTNSSERLLINAIMNLNSELIENWKDNTKRAINNKNEH